MTCPCRGRAVPGHQLRARRACGRSRSSARQAELCWHGDATINGVDAVVVPGGFAHGDYLRTGALARFSPVMTRGHRVRGRGRAGRRDLQRLPGAHRGAAAARRAAEERGPEVPVRDGRAPGRDDRRPCSPNECEVGAAPAHPDQPLRRQLRVRRRDARRSCAPTTASSCATSRTPTAASTTSPASATKAATSWASCRTPSAPPTRCSARPTASCCCVAARRRRRRASPRVSRAGAARRTRSATPSSRASGSALVADTFAAPTAQLLADLPPYAAALRRRHGLRARAHVGAAARAVPALRGHRARRVGRDGRRGARARCRARGSRSPT